MKIAILQLSDIHIRSDKDFIISHNEMFCRSCKSLINECAKLLVVITGDVAFSGNESEYEIAYTWLKKCEEFWRREAKFLNSVEYIVVPGNHDCDFSQPAGVRKILINTLFKADSIDPSDVESTCLSVQKNFWSFYGKLRNETLIPSISWTHDVRLKQDLYIIFNCYNSAFLSQLEEKPGELIIPQNKFIERDSDCQQSIVISLFHHNTGWLNPNTPSNNKKTFEEHIFNTANIVMCGHEHSQKHTKITSFSDSRELIYMENSAFQYENKSRYGLIILDTDDMNLTCYQFEYSDNEYQSSTECRSLSMMEKHSGVLFSNTWVDKLETINIPLRHTHKKPLRLSDIFVFPDMDPLSDIRIKGIQYTDSCELLGNSIPEHVILLEGENQSGKTSLLQMLCSSWYKKGVFPIMVLGKDIRHNNITSQLKSSYKEQYQSHKYPYERYMQLDKNKRIILIDDFDESQINNETKSKLLEGLLCNFEKVIATTGSQNSIMSSLLISNNVNDLKQYRILPFGYAKRNAIIDKWIRLGQDTISIDEEVLLNQVKLTYDKIAALLGQQLIPSYPVFILSLLQGLNNVLDIFDVSKTSYAYCYNSLIIASLLKSGTDQYKINGVMKFLTEFAYYLFNGEYKNNSFIKSDFIEYYRTYEKEYNVPSTADNLLIKLCSARIISCSEDKYYSFSYKYIYYYLVANKISQLINDNKAKGIVQELCSKLHKEQEANILIFLVYHNGTDKQMEDLLIASMLPFENYQPVTLNNNDSLFEGLNDIVDDVKARIMLRVTDPKKNREIALRKADNMAMQTQVGQQLSEQDFEENQYLKDYSNTFKIIRILGQIVKNQMETLKKEQILNLLEESYNVCFRSLAFFCKLIEVSKDEIVSFIMNKYDKISSADETKIKQHVHKLLHLLLYNQCLNSFTNLSYSVGTSNVPDIYDNVAKRINTPAAKIISFTINTYYNKMNINELKELVDEYKNNQVVLEIIKARVLSYVYNNYVELEQRQRIGQICNLKLINNGNITKGKEKYQ